MGLLDKIKGFFSGLFKRKDKEEEIKEKVQQEIKKVEPKVVNEEEVNKEENLKDIEQEVKREEVAVQLGLKEKDDLAKEKAKSDVKDEIIKKEQIKEKLRIAVKQGSSIDNIISPSEKVIELGTFSSNNQIENNLYNIYRNILLKNIEDRELINQIFATGLLDNRIVAKITLVYDLFDSEGKYTSTNKAEIELVGVSPKRFLELGIFDRLQAYSGTENGLVQTIKEFGATNTGGISENPSLYVKVNNTSVDFDYA